MFAKSTILLAAIALVSNAVAAQNSTIPPGCVLNAARLTGNPGNFKAVCGANSTFVHGNLADNCGSNVSAAESAYTSICKVHSYTVAPTSSSRSAKATKTASRGSSTNVSASTTADAAETGLASGTSVAGTEEAQATSTDAADSGASVAGYGMSAMAAVIAGLAIAI